MCKNVCIVCGQPEKDFMYVCKKCRTVIQFSERLIKDKFVEQVGIASSELFAMINIICNILVEADIISDEKINEVLSAENVRKLGQVLYNRADNKK